jgi:hypothetical protein
MDPPATWTTFALASEDLTGPVIGRTDGGAPVSEGDVIGLTGPSGSGRYRVERVVFLVQCYPDRWSNRLVLVEPV